jgi:hypothetical protein
MDVEESMPRSSQDLLSTPTNGVSAGCLNYYLVPIRQVIQTRHITLDMDLETRGT